jgi:hypothetical protein
MSNRFNIVFDSIGRAISTIIFFAAICLPFIGHIGGFFDESYILTTENRQPNRFPEYSDIVRNPGNFIASAESSINDHFGFREKLVRLNSLIRFNMGVSSSEKVTIGKDGWLYYSAENTIERYRGTERFSEDDIDSWLEAETAKKKWLSERNIRYIIALFPEKTSIYPEYLPEWAQSRVGITRLSRITEKLAGSGFDFIDVTPFLIEAKKEHLVYYKTDSHWNFHGGFAGYTALMNKLQPIFPGLKPLKSDDIELEYKKSYNQDLARILDLGEYLSDSNADFYRLKNSSHVISSESLNKNDRLPLVVRTDLHDAPSLLIIRDSYTDLLEPYLNETFREIIYLPHGDHTFKDDIILKYRPDIVISAMVERGLSYHSHGPVPEGQPYIVEWGPRKLVDGESFYLNTNGKPAVWIKALNINKTSIIVLGGVELKTDRNLENGVLAAYIPDEIFNREGDRDFFITNTDTGNSSKKFRFRIE